MNSMSIFCNRRIARMRALPPKLVNGKGKKKQSLPFSFVVGAVLLVLGMILNRQILSTLESLEDERLNKNADDIERASLSIPRPLPRPGVLTGNLTRLPDFLPQLPGCLTIQLRGQEEEVLTFRSLQGEEEKQTFLQALQARLTGSSSTLGPLSVGIVAVENPTIFVGLNRHWDFHLYHFLEFCTVAYAELLEMEKVMKALRQTQQGSKALSNSKLVDIAWWYSPVLTAKEICGGYRINCMILDRLWGQPDKSLPSVSPILSPISLYGVESNPPYMQKWHEAFRGYMRFRKRKVKLPPNPNVTASRQMAMLDQVDITLIIDRTECTKLQNINEMWTQWAHKFPAEDWREKTIQRHAIEPVDTHASRERLLVGYIDRQKESRRLPNRFHNWLVKYFENHPMIEFRHLHMETYSVNRQLELASDLDMMVGVHGNGLSHQLWMKPRSYVIEFFFDKEFKYDYSTTAQLMNHSMLVFRDTHIVDPDRIEAQDQTLEADELKKRAFRKNLKAGETAVKNFVEKALRERGFAQ